MEERVCLKGQLTVVINLGKRLHNFLPVHFAHPRQGVHIGTIVVIVHVQGVQAVMPQRADGVLRLLADNATVPKIQACHKMLIVQRIDIAAELGGSGADVMPDAFALRLVLPHILQCNLHVVLFGVRKQGFVELHILFKKFLLVPEVLRVMNRVHDSNLAAKQSRDFQRPHLTGEETLLILVRVFPVEHKRHVRLIKRNPQPVGIGAHFQGAGFVCVRVENIVVLGHAEQRHIDRVIACIFQNINRSLNAEGAHQMAVLRRKNHCFISFSQQFSSLVNRSAYSGSRRMRRT